MLCFFLTNIVVWIIVMFLSAVWTPFWRHPFTAENPLVIKWCNAKFLQISSVLMKKLMLNGLKVSQFEQVFICEQFL